MKGITPIIAIIVLLLITVAIAGAAWTYINVYFGGMTGKSIELTDTFCTNLGSGSYQTILLMRVAGTETVNVSDGGDVTYIVISGTETYENVSAITGEALPEDNARLIGPGGVWRVNFTATGTGVHQYRIVAGGRSVAATVRC